MTRNFTFKTLCLSFFTLCLVAFSATKSTAQCTLACLDQVNVSLPSADACEVEILPDMVLQSTCAGATVEIEGLMGAIVDAPGTYTVKVIDPVSGNECWGNLLVEDKEAPVLTCPIDFTISCADPSDPASVAEAIEEEMMTNLGTVGQGSGSFNGPENALLWGLMVAECSDYNLSFSDQYIDGGCDGDTIRRTFIAIDENGLTSTCTQEIFLMPESLTDLSLPSDYDCFSATAVCDDVILTYGVVTKEFVLACDGAGTEWNTLDNGLPSPYDKVVEDGVIPGTGTPGGLECGTLQTGYEDIVIDICDDECDQSSQSFKVVRQWTILEWCTGATITHNQIIKVLDTVPPTFNELPDVTISTTLWDCSASYELPSDADIDNCSNEISVNYRAAEGVITNGVLYLADNAVTSDSLPIEVYVDYSDCCGNIATDTFDLYVYDHIPPVPVADAHTVVSLSIEQEEGLTKVYAESFDDGSFDNCGPIGIGVRRMGGTCTGFSEEDDTGKYFDAIHFCCKDVGKTNMVEFRVCDDADGDGEFGTNGDNCNTAMVEVDVQDKLAPACSVPGPASIDCIDFAALGDLVNSGPLSGSEQDQIDALFGEATGAATCRVDLDQELTSTEDCGAGTVVRTVTVENRNNGLITTCSQTITITVDSLINFLTCGDISFPAGSAEQIAFTGAGISDVWCETNANLIGEEVNEGADLPAIEVMDCAGVAITSPVIDIDNLCSEVGINLELDTFDFAGGGCKKILAHWEIIDQCIFEENFFYEGEINPFVADNGYFELYVEYDLFDTEAPVIECGEGFIVDCGEEIVGSISASATDNCTDPSFFGWSWKLDVGNTGTFDFEGEGSSVSPADISLSAFPEGTHSITWIVSDGCGNESGESCEFGLSTEDTKAPTPYCYDGLSTAVMLENGVTLWAADFDAGSFDNCGDVFVSMIPESDTEGLSDAEAYAASLNQVLNTVTGNMEYGWMFDCSYIANGVSSTIDVRIYATDDSGNYDYCTASLRLEDNLGACTDTGAGLASLEGEIMTEEGIGVFEVEVEAMTNNPEYPRYTSTDENGMYAFSNNPTNNSYEITGEKNDDYTNGVSTLDLVLIQKHILQIESLDSPYKLIAADINNDSSVKASDLLQLRKLILGLYPEDRLPSNDSWRFVDNASSMSETPWPFDEVANVIDLTEDVMNADFTAVKIGDVNGSIEMSANSNAQVRSNAMTLALAEADYVAGEAVSLSFTSADFQDVYGFQFTLAYEGMEFVSMSSGVLEMTEANFGLNRTSEGVITVSYDAVKGSSANAEEVLFTLNFVAEEGISVSEVVNITSSHTAAEAYLGANLEVSDVKVEFRNGEELSEATTYALYQNEPNPFRGSTVISFTLPAAANATLKVYDVTGKVLYSTTAGYAKGLNSVNVENIGQSGVLYYQLSSDDFTATKKMIVIE